MRKLLAILISLPVLSFASSLDMATLKCQTTPDKKALNISPTTTLKQVQDNCLIADEKTHDGMYEVKFKDDASGKNVKCDFATNTPTATVNGCR